MKPVTFIQVTDTHLFKSEEETLCAVETTDSLKQVLADVKKFRPRPDFFLITGDISQDGTPASYQKFKKMLAPFNCPVLCLPGNHDLPAKVKKELARGAVKSTQEYVCGEWKLILLDSARPPHPGGYLRSSEISRLKRSLLMEKKRNILIAMHHNPIPVGSEWMDRMMIKNAFTFKKIIEAAPNVRAILFGHVHQEFEATKNNRLYLGTPSTSVQFVPGLKKMKVDRRPPGFRWVQLFPNGKVESDVVRIKKFAQVPDYNSAGY